MIFKAPPERKVPPPFSWAWRQLPAVTLQRWHFTVSEVSAPGNCPPDTAFFDADKLPDVLEITPPRPGDRMIPFGGETAVKIKKLRIDRHITSDHPLPVMRTGEGICWAPMIRHSAMAAVTDRTCRIVKFEFKELD